MWGETGRGAGNCMRTAILKRETTGGLAKKMIFEQRFDKSEEMSHRDKWGCVHIKTTPSSESQG